MACVLKPDSSFAFDFTASTGAQSTVKVTAGGNARFVAATQNNTKLAIQNQDTVSFTIAAGVNLLEFVIAVADPKDTVVILEDCGGGQTQEVERFKNDPGDPVTGFSVFGF
jgi:hypothetical protein